MKKSIEKQKLQTENADFRRQMDELEQKLKESNRRFDVLVENLNGMAYRCANNPSWTMEYVSAGAEALTGYTPDQIIANRRVAYGDLIHPDDRRMVWEEIQQALHHQKGFQMTYRIRDALNREKWVWEQGCGIFSADGALLALEGFITDISELKQAEARIRKLNRVYAVLSDINQAIVRIREPQKLFERSCRIAIESGGFSMAWLAITDPETKAIRIAAHAGADEDYLKKLHLALDDTSLGFDPTGTVLREGRHVIVDNIENDPRMIPWHKEAIKRGFHSAAAFPLSVSGQIRGAFSLYADEIGFFDDEEIELLDELAMDISLAMEVIEQEQQKQQNAKQLLESENRYRSLFENNHAVMLIVDPANAAIVDANPAACAYYGWPREVLRKKKIIDINTLTEEQVRVEMAAARTAQRNHFLFKHRRAEGSIRDVEVYSGPIHLEGRDLLYSIIHDVTERIHAQDELAKSETRFRSLVDGAPDAIFVQTDHCFSYLNAAALKLFGADSPEQLLGRPVLDRLHPSVRDAVHLRIHKLNIEKKNVPMLEAVYLRLDNSEVPVEVAAVPTVFEGKDGALVFVRDISERKKIITELKNRNRFIHTILDNLPIGLAVNEIATGRAKYMNKQFEEIYGWSQDQLVSVEQFFECVYPDPAYRSVIKKRIMDDIASGDSRRMRWDDITITTRSGRKKIVSAKNIPLYEQNLMISTVQDVTDRKQAEAERERLMAAIEQAAEMVVITDNTGIIQYVNPAFERITGYNSREAVGQTPRILKSDHHDQRFYKNLWGTILSGNRWTGRLINKRRDGTLYTTECSISPVKNNQNVVGNYVWISRDITNEIDLEKKVMQAQKMESIGNLAGGIAHDFNNILSSVIGYSELALDDAEKNSVMEAYLQQIYAAGKRARDLVKQILTFARQSEEEIKPIQVHTIAREVLKFIRSSIPATIEIRSKIEISAPIMGNPTQVHQLLMNLCTNAAHSMEDNGGILEVDLKEVTMQSSATTSRLGLSPGNYLEIVVRDTGIGIAPENMDAIFEPYFTTKGPGEGTGLGLAMVHGIVESYGGKISVESELGKGTRFTIYLPVTGMRGAYRSDESKVLPSGTERILFVDDEAPIALISSQMLERLGYSVTTRTSSVEALELFRTKPTDFDLVITDMTMPNMTGDKLAVELMRIRSDIPVILCTGYSRKISDESASEIGIKGFAYKPVVKADLAKIVRQVLDEAKSRAGTA